MKLVFWFASSFWWWVWRWTVGLFGPAVALSGIFVPIGVASVAPMATIKANLAGSWKSASERSFPELY